MQGSQRKSSLSKPFFWRRETMLGTKMHQLFTGNDQTKKSTVVGDEITVGFM